MNTTGLCVQHPIDLRSFPRSSQTEAKDHEPTIEQVFIAAEGVLALNLNDLPTGSCGLLCGSLGQAEVAIAQGL